MATKEKKSKEFKAVYLKEYKEPVFTPKIVAGLNDSTINSDISIE